MCNYIIFKDPFSCRLHFYNKKYSSLESCYIVAAQDQLGPLDVDTLCSGSSEISFLGQMQGELARFAQ